MKEEMLLNKFERFERLVGKDEFLRIRNKTVLIVGVGGVGGYVLESLVRCGVNEVIIVDFDTVDETNINRQIIALESTIGSLKVDVFEKRIKDINPLCNVIKMPIFLDEDNISNLFSHKIDYLIDACDTVKTKKCLINECIKRNIKFISCMGTGNKLDPSKLEITDIRNTKNDPLARIMRKYVRDLKIKDKVMVLSSSEVPIKVEGGVLASTSFVPSSAGLLISSYVIREFLNEK